MALFSRDAEDLQLSGSKNFLAISKLSSCLSEIRIACKASKEGNGKAGLSSGSGWVVVAISSSTSSHPNDMKAGYQSADWVNSFAMEGCSL